MQKSILAFLAMCWAMSACHHPHCDPQCPHEASGTIEYCQVDSSWFINVYQSSTSPGNVFLLRVNQLDPAFQVNAKNVKFKFAFTGDSTDFMCSGCGTPPLPRIANVNICEMQDDTSGGVIIMKPVIYLYPEKQTTVDVQLNFDGRYTSTYPKYNVIRKGWKVKATPNGQLLNEDDGITYPYLFWEGQPNTPYEFDMLEGFCVKGSDTRAFLQDILPQLGLLPKEYHDMIVFWLPRMERNAYNLIHFAGETYSAKAPLNITPKPDQLIRVFMAFQPSLKKVEMKSPYITPVERKGFTVVEWGGVEMPAEEMMVLNSAQ